MEKEAHSDVVTGGQSESNLPADNISVDPPQGTGDPPQGSCAFYMLRKHRYCKVRPKPDDRYCAEHSCFEKITAGEEVGIKRKRSRCPYNSNHTFYEEKREKHLKVCPSKESALEIYYQRDINSGMADGSVSKGEKLTVRLASAGDIQAMIDKINNLYSEHIGDLPEDEQCPDCLKNQLPDRDSGIQAFRQHKQQFSMIGHLEKQNLLQDGYCYVEMGAGKGGLSHWIQQALPSHENALFLLIDRKHTRYKFDSYHRRDDQGPSFERIWIDIKDLNLSKVPLLESSKEIPVVVISKHLCGAATDLALRCAMETINCNSEQDTTYKSGTIIPHGIAIALCCHHRCCWQSYTGKEFLQQCGISQLDFELITSMTSWAACNWKGWREHAGNQSKESSSVKKVLTGNESSTQPVSTDTSLIKTDDQAEFIHAENDKANLFRCKCTLPVVERALVGWKCKRLLDFGRVKYLQSHGLDAKLTTYISHELTPENVAIFASKQDERT